MKKQIFLLLSTSLLLFASCTNDLRKDCVEVRLITELCGNAVLQVVDNSSDIKLDTWTDENGQEHQNVFSTFLNPCSDYPQDSKSTFFIQLTDSTERGNCVVCLALPSNMPETFHHTKVVEPCFNRVPEQP